MDDRRFRELVRIAIEAERLDDRSASDPRTPACLSMARLDEIATLVTHPTPVEDQHIGSCELCSARLKALKTVTEARGDGTYHGKRTIRKWAFGASMAAMAAVVVLLIIPWQSWSPDGEFGLHISTLPRVTRSAGRIEREFRLSVERSCSVILLYRTWNGEHQRLDWRPHVWADGGAVAELAQGEQIVVSLDVTNDPPVEQALVAVASRSTSRLLVSKPDLASLIDCLRRRMPPASVDREGADHAAAVRDCVPVGQQVEAVLFRIEP